MAKSGIIKTKRLTIEPFSIKHLSFKYLSWLNNRQIVKYSEQRHKKHTRQSCYHYLDSFKKTPNYFWAISIDKGNINHIGNITAYIDEFNKIADLGILIGEIKARKKGYAIEAWMAVCDYLFNKLGIRKITAGTLAINKDMLKLMQKVGMTNDGRRKKQIMWEGQEVDVIYGAMFNKQLKK